MHHPLARKPEERLAFGKYPSQFVTSPGGLGIEASGEGTNCVVGNLAAVGQKGTARHERSGRGLPWTRRFEFFNALSRSLVSRCTVN